MIKTDLQIAQELKEKILHYDWEADEAVDAWDNDSYDFTESQIIAIKKQAKSNLENLGCGECFDNNGSICGEKEYDMCGEYIIYYCPDCLANGVDKAKEIYEGILNLNSEEDE